MLYITRSRYKEALSAEGLVEVNKFYDAEFLPAIESVEGVRSAKAYNSITGELTLVQDVEDLTTMDRVIASPGLRSVGTKISDMLVRTGGEILYDRTQWLGMYGRFRAVV